MGERRKVALHNGVDAEEVAAVTSDVNDTLPATVRILAFDFDVEAPFLLVELNTRRHNFSFGRSVVSKGEAGICPRLMLGVIHFQFLLALDASRIGADVIQLVVFSPFGLGEFVVLHERWRQAELFHQRLFDLVRDPAVPEIPGPFWSLEVLADDLEVLENLDHVVPVVGDPLEVAIASRACVDDTPCRRALMPLAHAAHDGHSETVVPVALVLSRIGVENLRRFLRKRVVKMLAGLVDAFLHLFIGFCARHRYSPFPLSPWGMR